MGSSPVERNDRAGPASLVHPADDSTRNVILPSLVGLTLAFIAASRMNGELWRIGSIKAVYSEIEVESATFPADAKNAWRQRQLLSGL